MHINLCEESVKLIDTCSFDQNLISSQFNYVNFDQDHGITEAKLKDWIFTDKVQIPTYNTGLISYKYMTSTLTNFRLGRAEVWAKMRFLLVTSNHT